MIIQFCLKKYNVLFSATAAPMGLGGSTTTNAAGALNIGGGVSTLGTNTAEKENIRDGEVPAPIMELLKQVQ